MPESAAYRLEARALAPAKAVHTGLEITHPDVAAPVRVVDDAVRQVLGGVAFEALAFRIRLVDDPEGGVPRCEVAMDNVGDALTQWIERSNGGAGASVKVMQWVDGAAAADWEQTMEVQSMRVDALEVVAVLGFEPLLQRRAIRLRHDPQTSPGLF